MGVKSPLGSQAVRMALLVCGIALPTAVAAQLPRVALPSREQIEPPIPDRPPPSRVQVDSSEALQPAPCPLEQYDVKVRLERVTFTGVGGAELAPEIRALLGDVAPASAEEQPIAAVCGIRDRANAKLRAAGYVATVQIPPQTIETGELRLEVVTAKIVEVRILGDAPPYRDILARRADQLKTLDPLNERDAERILLLAGDIPGIDVQLALRPAGTNPGEVIGELTVLYRRFSLVANGQNYGSTQLGRETGYVRGELFGLTGYSDVTYVGFSTTADFDEQQVVQVGHLAGLGDFGTTVEGSFIYAWSKPDLGQLDLRSETLVGRLEMVAPLLRTRRETIYFGLGGEIIEQRTRVYSADASTPLNRDKLRVPFLRVDASVFEPLFGGGEAYSLRGRLELRHGLNIFGATQQGEIEDGYTPSRIAGDPDAFVIRGEVEGEVGIGPIFTLAGAAYGQWADNPLLNFEEFSLGNLTYGRGYDPGANSSDKALALRAEGRAKVYEDVDIRGEVFAFYDSVWIWNLDPNATETDRRLGSWGGGVRALLRGRAYLEMIYAHPEDVALRLPGATRAPDRLLLSLTVQFGPGGR